MDRQTAVRIAGRFLFTICNFEIYPEVQISVTSSKQGDGRLVVLCGTSGPLEVGMGGGL